MNNKYANENVFDACVIGAGASGLVCASELAKRGYSTLLLEQNKKSGRKIYATGNGRCNIANAVLSSSAYYGDGFAARVVNNGSITLLKRDLEQMGIPLFEKEGYIYPQSMQASSVVWALTDAARLAGAEIIYERELRNVKRTEAGGFMLETVSPKNGGSYTYFSNRLILSAGSPAGEELGAAKEDTLTSILSELGLPYTPFEPALCPLIVEEDVKELAGVRTRVMLKLGLSMDHSLKNDILMEDGELQLTDYGISGIAVFNLSTVAHIGECISIDLLPSWKDEESILHFIRKQDGRRSIYGALNGLLHEKLCLYFLKLKCGKENVKKPLLEFKDEELLDLIRLMKDWRLSIKGKKGSQGQAQRGGVQTQYLSPETMQVYNEPRIAVTGELCNVVGRCGGYNLMFALISGMRAGQKIK